jgi:hypothetical protein
MLALNEYEALLRLSSESSVWTWHKEMIDGRALEVLAERLPGMAGHVLPDDRERPLGIFMARLLHELGALTHENGQLVVRPPFLDAKGRVKLSFSVATPWSVREVAAETVNEFLRAALVVGDGIFREAAHDAEGSRGYEVSRALELLWTSPEAGRGVLAAEDPEELHFAFELDHGELRIVNCGLPRFTPVDLAVLKAEGWTEIEPPRAHPTFPKAFAWKDPLGAPEQRFYLPGTEAASELRLYGGAFEGGQERSPLHAFFKDNGPSIRVHLEYVPGWRAVSLARQRVHIWSALSESFKNEVLSRSLVVREA